MADDQTVPADGEGRNDVDAVRWLLSGADPAGAPEDFSDVDAADEDLLAPPVHWPSVEAEEVPQRLTQLFEWTCELQGRFPEMVRLPSCWPRHNSLVELLQALSDAERACYASTSPPTAAADWHRVFADLEHRIRGWVGQLGCGGTATATKGHTPPDRGAENPGVDQLETAITARTAPTELVTQAVVT